MDSKNDQATATAKSCEETESRINRICVSSARIIIGPATVRFVASLLRLQNRCPNLTVPLVIFVFLYGVGTALACLLGTNLALLNVPRLSVVLVASFSIGITSPKTSELF